jgi:hypothetical protein
VGPEDFGRLTNLHPQSTINDGRWHSLSRLLTNLFFGPFDPKSRPYQIRLAVIGLSDPVLTGNWEKLRELTEEWILLTGDPVLTAAFAEVMDASDRAKTQAWLAATLRSQDTKLTTECLLAASGAVANTNLLIELEMLASVTGNVARVNDQNRGYLNYALHRCRRIQDWKLTRLGNARFAITRL